MKASQNFTCVKCGETIFAGTEYTWNRRMVGNNKFHLSCVKNASEDIDFIEGVEDTTTTNKKPVDTSKLVQGMQELMQSIASNALDENRVLELIDERMQTVASTELVQKITIEVHHAETGVVKKLDITHKMFSTVLNFVSKCKRRVNLYLHGLPSCGKSTIAEQIAYALDLPYYFLSLNRQSQASLIMGYMNASGEYVSTTFRQWYEFGGIFQFDEKDNTQGNLLTMLNSATDNGLCAFPDKIVSRHPKAILIASGNTNGNGPTRMFPDRCPMDAAEKDRYKFYEITFDEQMEQTIAEKIAISYDQSANTGSVISAWISKVRAYCKEYHAELLVSQRATYGIVESICMSEDVTTALDSSLFKGINELVKNEILNKFPFPVVTLKTVEPSNSVEGETYFVVNGESNAN